MGDTVARAGDAPPADAGAWRGNKWYVVAWATLAAPPRVDPATFERQHARLAARMKAS